MIMRSSLLMAVSALSLVTACAPQQGPMDAPFVTPDALSPGQSRPMGESRAAAVFPPADISTAEAEQLLAEDPMALRFLALRDALDRGLLRPAEVSGRKFANMGALLPMTTPLAPAAGLDRPIPALADIQARLGQLQAPASTGERTYLLDHLLPQAPGKRQMLAPTSIDAARQVQARLDRLRRAGLISRQEQDAEQQALDGLIAGGVMPSQMAAQDAAKPAAPAKKPAPEKKTGPAKTPSGGGSGQRMPGGVSGKLVVIPSPPGVDAPKLTDKDKGPVGVHILSMASSVHGDKAWETLKAENPELASLGHTVVRADLGDLGVTYRLVAGPVDRDQAQKICDALRQRSQTCATTPFPTAGQPAAAPAAATPTALTAPASPPVSATPVSPTPAPAQ